MKLRHDLRKQLEECARLGAVDVAAWTPVGHRDATVILESMEITEVVITMRRWARQRRLTVATMTRLLARPTMNEVRLIRREERQRSDACQ